MNETIECLSLTSLLGLTEKEACAKIRGASLIDNIVCRDGEWFVCTAEDRPDRVNLTIEQGKVIKVTTG
jgi:hypothetical protein